MGVDAIIAIVIGMIKGANAAYTFAKEVAGDIPIPSWDALVSQNSELQAKIDAEK